jgi:tRNA(fMet)-specific endonuclease VapC
MIVLDTDVVSNLMSKQPSERVVMQLADVPIDEQFTTSITVGELAYGAHHVGRPDLYERAMQVLREVIVVPFDTGAAEHYGRIRADLERRGTRLADPDLRIAAIVVLHGATLVTRNHRHFQRVPELKLADWFAT